MIYEKSADIHLLLQPSGGHDLAFKAEKGSMMQNERPPVAGRSPRKETYEMDTSNIDSKAL
jgi:hypothetical protein